MSEKVVRYILFGLLISAVLYILYKWMYPFKYFKYSEFDDPTVPGSGELYMSEEFIKKLDKARGIAGVPFKINSGYRTKEHNLEVGGVANSAHTLGLAADIAITPETKQKIASALYKAGFKRLGFANSFIHVDLDKSKPQTVWNYSGAEILYT